MNRALLHAAILMTLGSGCGQTHSSSPESRAQKPISGSRFSVEPELQPAALAEAVQSARASVEKSRHDSKPFKYVQGFEEKLRPQIEQLTGRKVPPLPIDDRDVARPMYEAWANMINQPSDKATYIGDAEKGAKRKEAVSLQSNGLQCTAIVIGRNAIVTANHCTNNLSENVFPGPDSTSGTKITIDPKAFKPLKDINGMELDLAILVRKDPIGGGLTDADLPVFASTAMVDAAKEWKIVGYGGNESNGAGSGVKRLGRVPNLDAACSQIGVAKAYNCTPGFEIVAGARPLEDRVGCVTTESGELVQGACGGDSGGAVYVEKDNKLYLAAVIRRIEDPLKCGCSIATNVYVRLDKQLPDIRKIADIQIPKSSFAEFDKP